MHAIRIGELLVRDGVISSQQLEAGLKLHRHAGERLGSCLMELGFVRGDSLARALAKQQHVPAVLAQQVVAIDPAIIALLPARLAQSLHAIPIAYTQTHPRRLVVALRDPLTTPLEEIAFAAGVRVDAAIAPAARIRACLGSYYGVKSVRPTGAITASWQELDLARDASMDEGLVLPEEAPTARRTVAFDMPMPSSAFPPASRETVTLDMPMPSLAVPSHDRAISRETVALEMPMPSLAVPSGPPSGRADEPSSETSPPSQIQTAPPPAPYGALAGTLRTSDPVIPAFAAADDEAELDTGWDDIPEEKPEGSPSTGTAPPEALRPFLDLPTAIATLRSATSREAIGDALATWLQSTFGSGLVLIVKDGRALGWKGYAPDAEQHEIEWIAMPLGPMSMLKPAYDGKVVFRGAPSAEGAVFHERLWQLLHCSPPGEVIVGPIVLAGRVVNLLYAHPPKGETLPSSAMEEMSRIASVAATEYARLIRARGK